MSRDPFLEASDVVDLAHPDVAALARSLGGADVLDTTQRCFTWVRDEVEHSVDFARDTLTCSASEALLHRTGFCYAKSHLLVALLRANDIRSGFVYQRLTVDGDTAPFCLHGLVGVFLPSHGLFRIDPRGNKPGVDARCEPPVERLAFTNTHPGERLFEGVRATPLPVVVAALRTKGSVREVLACLPDATSID